MSVDKEGTKLGFDFDMYKLFRKEIEGTTIILEGGAGKLT